MITAELEIEKALIGKTINSAIVNGYEVVLCFDDDTIFNYDASDGGYSSYELTLLSSAS